MPRFCALLMLLAVSYFSTSAIAQSPEIQLHPDFARFFEQAGTVGTIVVLDVRTNVAQVYNAKRAAELFPPASTFKILNSLIALETGVVTDVDTQIFKWDGVTRGRPELNKDHTLRTAIAVSALPVYQQIARDVGLERMTRYLNMVGYGVGEVTNENLDWFWVLRGFRISANEQVKFLRRLYFEDLPFSKKSIAAVKDITVLERSKDYVFHGKTGWTTDTDPSTGWFVGWIGRGNKASVFALNMDMHDDSQGPARIAITKNVLRALDLL
jgi:beta-lactamase class D